MATVFNRVNTLLLVLLVLMAAGIIALLAQRASAGPLDPPAAPGSTMHTLGDTPPSWDQVLDSTNGAAGPIPPAGCNSDRFKCVMVVTFGCNPICAVTYPAVLDEETGLVWQRSPSGTAVTFEAAVGACEGITAGNRGGWRVPTLAELGSLIATGVQLPSGSPFSLPTASYWWTSTLTVSDASKAYALGGGSLWTLQNTSQANVWCVRGASSTR
jgi:Protein of unknown function (DUF1566)